LFDQITQADNLQPRLLVVESHDMADPGFDKVIDNIYQEILDRSSQQKKSNS